MLVLLLVGPTTAAATDSALVLPEDGIFELLGPTLRSEPAGCATQCKDGSLAAPDVSL